MVRNREFEDRLLCAVSRHAERSFGVDCSAYPGAVRAALVSAAVFGAAADHFARVAARALREGS